MTKPRRTRADSVSAAVELSGYQQVSPPENVPLDDRDMTFFRSVLAELSRSEWTSHSLELAAYLARAMADIESDQRLLREEGSILKTDKGTPVVNPRKSLIQMNAATILSIRRSLSLHARAQGGEARDIAKRRGITKEYDGETDGDGLLAGAH